MRTHWRDCKSWIDDGLALSTTNNESCKLFDAALTQICGFYNDPSLGGLEKTMKDMIKNDPEFVMGHAFVNSLKGDGIRVQDNEEFKNSIDSMIQLAEKQNITERERKHVLAVKLLAEGERSKAMEQWEDILIDHPTDLFATRSAMNCGFTLGKPVRYRDMLSRVSSVYTPSTPGYSNILSYHAFAMEETFMYDLAEKKAKLSLEIESRETWATHTLAHIYESQGRTSEGHTFMTDTVADWSSCEMLACHNYWHTALFCINKGDFDEAISIFDDEILPRAKKSGAMFPLLDGSSLLYRLQFEKCSVKERWQDLVDLSQKHVGNHTWMLNDSHLMMIACSGKQPAMAETILQGLKDFAKDCTGNNALVTKETGIRLCEGIKAYQDGEYDKATTILSSIKYDIITLGGSHAQRDVFNQLLIHAALKSPCKEHVKFGRLLLAERKAFKETDCLTDRLMAQALQQHIVQ